MTNLVAAEFEKLRTTRTFIWISLLALGLVAFVAVANLAGGNVDSEETARQVLSSMGAAGTVILILGVVGAAGEYRHRTITSTFLISPDRFRILIAKAIAYALAVWRWRQWQHS